MLVILWMLVLAISAPAMAQEAAEQTHDQDRSNQLNDEFVRMLDRAFVCALSLDENGEFISAAFGIMIDDETMLTALAPLLDGAEIQVHNFQDDPRDAEGFVAFDPQSGLALLRITDLNAEPFTGEIVALPAVIPETLPAALVMDMAVGDAPGIGFEAFTTKGQLDRKEYSPLVLLHKRPRSIYAGTVILGAPNTIVGIVTTPINPYTVGVSALTDYKSMTRIEPPVRADKLIDLAADNTSKAILLTHQAQNRLFRDQHRETLALIARALELDPANTTTWYIQGECFSKQQDYQSALESYSKAIGQGGDWGNLWYALGYAQFMTGDIPSATASLENAVERDVYHPAALGLLAMLMHSDSRFNAGFDFAIRACAIENDNLDHLTTLRKCNERIERWDEMMPYWYRYMRSTNSRDVDLWRDYISGFMGAVEYHVMTREAERGLKLIGEQDFLLAAIAWRRLLDQQFDDAIDLATRALELNPESKLAAHVLENARDPIILGEDGED